MYHYQKLLAAAVLLLPNCAPGANGRYTIEQMTEASGKIVLGSVLSRTSYWAGASRIHTDVIVAVDVTIRGEETSTVVVQVPGGRVGETEMTVSDAPVFQDGERVLLFLTPENDALHVVGRDSGKRRPEASEIDVVVNVLERRSGKSIEHKREAAKEFVSRGVTRKRELNAADVIGDSASSSCYSSTGVRWPGNSVTYRTAANVPAHWESSIAAAAAAWTNAGALFSLTGSLASANEVSVADLVAQYGSTYASTYAVATTWTNTGTNQITQAKIEINSHYNWSASAQAGMPDVQNILTHEFGHWLRLGDIYSPAECSETTMWSTSSFGEVKKRTLEQADIDGLLSLYGRSAPMTPELISPANGATGLPLQTRITWAHVPEAVTYDVYLGYTTPPPLYGTTAAADMGITLSGAGTIYWRVVARNAQGATSSSPVWSFSVLPAAVLPPSNPSPANAATGVSARPVLSWTASAGATSYDVYFGTSATPSLATNTTLTSYNPGQLLAGVTYYWRVAARNGSASALSAAWSFTTIAPAVSPARAILWQQTASRQAVLWQMGGTLGATIQRWAWLTSQGVPGWSIVGRADLDRDGTPDLIWQNDSTRQVTVWYMAGADGGSLLRYDWIASVSQPAWRVAAVTDLNGDGSPDVIWQNDTTGEVSAWYLGGRGGNVLQAFALVAAPGPDWRCAAAADVDGNGRPDLIWQHKITRQVTYWSMSGAQLTAWGMLAGPTPGWRVAGATDLNSDGTPDLLWQNDSTYQATVWFLRGGPVPAVYDWAWLASSGVSGWRLMGP